MAYDHLNSKFANLQNVILRSFFNSVLQLLLKIIPKTVITEDYFQFILKNMHKTIIIEDHILGFVPSQYVWSWTVIEDQTKQMTIMGKLYPNFIK